MDYNGAMKPIPMIMLHGWGMPAAVFAPLLPLLESSYQVITPGLPGYADSPWPGGNDFSTQLEQMARSLPAGHLLGWSLGGIYAIELARRFPRQFSAVTLLAYNPCFVRRSGWQCAVEATLLEGFSRELDSDCQRTLRRFLALQFQGEKRARDLTRDLWRQLVAAGETDIGVLKFGLDLLANRDTRPALAELVQPLKLILGELDLLVPITLQRQIHAINPAIQVESVAGAAHAPFISHPTQVAAWL